MPDTGNNVGLHFGQGFTVSMASNKRILNITRNYWLKPSQAFRGIENCSCVWLEEGVSVRDLSLAESIAARNVQAKVREPLSVAEIPGITFDRETNWTLVSQANRFVDSKSQAQA